MNFQKILDEATDNWGIKVERVEMKNMQLPQQMQRAMAAEAEAAREARAKVFERNFAQIRVKSPSHFPGDCGRRRAKGVDGTPGRGPNHCGLANRPATALPANPANNQCRAQLNHCVPVPGGPDLLSD